MKRISGNSSSHELVAINGETQVIGRHPESERMVSNGDDNSGVIPDSILDDSTSKNAGNPMNDVNCEPRESKDSDNEVIGRVVGKRKGRHEEEIVIKREADCENEVIINDDKRKRDNENDCAHNGVTAARSVKGDDERGLPTKKAPANDSNYLVNNLQHLFNKILRDHQTRSKDASLSKDSRHTSASEPEERKKLTIAERIQRLNQKSNIGKERPTLDSNNSDPTDGVDSPIEIASDNQKVSNIDSKAISDFDQYYTDEEDEEEEKEKEMEETASKANSNRQSDLPKYFLCQKCPRAFATEFLLVQHTNVHEHVDPHKCWFCGKGFSYLYNLKKHEDRHEYTSSSSRESGHESVQKEGSEVESLSEVGAETSAAEENTVVRRKWDNRPSKQRTYGQLEYYYRIGKYQRKPRTKNASIKCRYCLRLYSQLKRLQDHEMCHEEYEKETGEFECRNCDRSFISEVRRKLHEGTVHRGRQPPAFECRRCGKRFSLAHNLRRHERFTHNGYSRTTTEMTTKTTETTTPIKKFKCDECGKVMSRREHLRRHKAVHSGEKPFHCSICLKSFVRLTYLESHMSKHNSEKTFACTSCRESFTTFHYLRMHITTCRGISRNERLIRGEHWEVIAAMP